MKDLKIFAKTVDQKALDQIDLLLSQEPFKDCKVRIMPDVHAGKGCVIGFTANLGNKVIPNIVGVDIGCGMLTVELGQVDINYNDLDRKIRRLIPSGMAVHESASMILVPFLRSFYCSDHLHDVDWLLSSMGTLGGGNHFIEVDEDDKGNKYLIIHTGSRNLGKQVAEIYQNLAIYRIRSMKSERMELIERLKAEGREKEISGELKKLKAKTSIPNDLCYLEGEDRENYLHDMKLCQDFARSNRNRIADLICYSMGWKPVHKFHTVHNYIDDTGMVRKGAISARADEPLLIPINMRDGCILGHGRGNKDWNQSAPHGAGRLMSRKEAKASIPISEYEATMAGIWSTSVSAATLDEAPQAYKPMDEILSCISETVNVDRIIKPVYSFKAGER